MENPIPNISRDFCFTPLGQSIQLNQKALKLYSDGLGTASKLEGDYPIFLDTNVLLDYYKISFSEREQLTRFLETNKNRIHLTKQVELEFLKHRIDHIKSYLKSLDEFVAAYRNIKAEIEKLKNGEIRGFDHYLNTNTILKNDYQDLRNELTQLKDTIKHKLTELFQESRFELEINEKEVKLEEIKKRLEGQADIERNDPLLDVIAEFHVTEELSDEETQLLEDIYEELFQKYEKFKGDQNFNWKHTFPGCGEKKEEPYGDFIIYHELIKFMKHNSTDIIFLTNDVEKNDWLLRNKAELLPFTHYIVNTYSSTGQTLYIFQAKDKIRVSYQPIYVEERREEEQSKDGELFSNRVTLQGPKIVGKIDLPDYGEDQVLDLENIDFDDYHFSDITDDEFIRELQESQVWAKTYGDNFIGVRSFILKYLGGKGYNFRTSFNVKDRLVEREIVEEYIHKSKQPYFNDVQALRLKTKQPALKVG